MGNTQEVKGTLARKAGNGKGFLIEGDEGWFNATEASTPYLAKLAVGDEVEISFFKKGVTRVVTQIKKASGEPKAAAEAPSTEKCCTVCGKVLKNPNFPTCWDCKNKAPKEEAKSKVYDKPAEAKTYKSYDNPEKTAQIQRGNALNAAAAIMSNPNVAMQDTSPEALAEATKMLANTLLDWLRAE